MLRRMPASDADRPRVVVLDDYQHAAAAAADWSGLDVGFVHEHLAGTDALVGAIGDAPVVVAMRERTPFDAERLRRLPDLRLLVTTGMFNAAIDLDAARAAGIMVCGTRARPTPTTELTWALLLALARQVAAEDAQVRAGGWQHTLGRELAGSTLGLVGLGRLGSAMVPIARAFEMDVIAWSQNLDAARADEAGVEAAGKRELFERADVVSVHYKLSQRSTGLVGEDELAALGPDGLLVNTSRGPIVDRDALLRALHDATIAGAALDVYDEEPLPADDPLRTAPRTVLTPHIGYVSRENYATFYGDAAEDVRAWLAGSPVRRIA
jgi:phosphoglycerate dehydrogenase-like enzyme